MIIFLREIVINPIAYFSIMGRYGSKFREPPWVIGSSREVMDWNDAVSPSKNEQKKVHKTSERYLKNLHVHFDFKSNNEEITPDNFFRKIMVKLTGKKQILEDIDLFEKAELILRGLIKAKFRNAVRILIDKNEIYFHPEKTTDLRKTIEILHDNIGKFEKPTYIEMIMMIHDVKKCTVQVKIKKIHDFKKHTVEMYFNGEIREDLYHSFLNYLNENVDAKDIGY